MTTAECLCHKESGSHELCCGRDGGRNPDCSLHGDGSGPVSIEKLIKEVEMTPQKAPRSKGRKQFLHTVFITAMEGGINYWALTSEYHWGTDGGVKIVEDIDQFYAVITSTEDDWGTYKVYQPVLGLRDPVTLASDNQPLTIDIDVMERGANLLVDKVIAVAKAEDNECDFSRKYLRQFVSAWLSDGDEGDFDSEVADLVVQLGLFGEVVYA